MPSAPRLDARWIRKRDPTELTAAFGALARSSLPAWHLDVHAHRAPLTTIVRDATEAVGSQKVKLHKPYVSLEIGAISRLRSRLLNRKCRGEQTIKKTDLLRVFLLWREYASHHDTRIGRHCIAPCSPGLLLFRTSLFPLYHSQRQEAFALQKEIVGCERALKRLPHPA